MPSPSKKSRVPEVHSPNLTLPEFLDFLDRHPEHREQIDLSKEEIEKLLDEENIERTNARKKYLKNKNKNHERMKKIWRESKKKNSYKKFLREFDYFDEKIGGKNIGKNRKTRKIKK